MFKSTIFPKSSKFQNSAPDYNFFRIQKFRTESQIVHNFQNHIKHNIHYHSKFIIMGFITKMSEEEIKNANEKSYKVTIGDSSCNRLSFELSRVEFESINVFEFVELGFFVSIYKLNHVQDIE